MNKFVIVYLSDSGSLYTEEFVNRESVDRWLDTHEYKAHVIEINGDYKLEDRT